MQCTDINDCLKQIQDYYTGEKTGHFLLVNTENYDVYQGILQRLQTDKQKHCFFVSNNLYPNGLPNIEPVIVKAASDECSVVIGLSPACMIQSENTLDAKLDELLGTSISGYSVILLDHCDKYLRRYLWRDKRIDRRVLFVEGVSSSLPSIQLLPTNQNPIGKKPLDGIGGLLRKLENFSESELKSDPVLLVSTSFQPASFTKAVYSVSAASNTYVMLCKKYHDISNATEEKYGTDKEWEYLAGKLSEHSSFSELICAEFGAITNLSAHIEDVWESQDTLVQWLLWLALKVFGEKSNSYLTFLLNKDGTAASFVEQIYLSLADVKHTQNDFDKMYQERKRLIDKIPEQLPLISRYCERIGIYQNDAVYYLTDSTDIERYEFMRLLSESEFSEGELLAIVSRFSADLALYLRPFTFDTSNTKLSEADSDLRAKLTDYFKEYKIQKLTNRIHPDFLSTVNTFAISRPYNKLQPRSRIISHMDRDDMELFFFDALGVEYLAYIIAKCETYGIMTELSIGHCELPSITVKNKEFDQFFSDSIYHKIDELDEMKHHSQVFNYEKCPYPTHLFQELEVIDSELRRIHSLLIQGTLKKALVVADHGASRLAVLYGHENEPPIPLSEPGEHSGRCCQIADDPNLENAAYEDGFAVLANYDRFKGGRRANVEVHGGATLEEVLVPVMILSKKPDKINICFVDSVIILIPREIPKLTIYSNIPLTNPRLRVNGEFIDGTLVGDKKHAVFELPKIKRKGEYTAEVFDGQKNMAVTLTFSARKNTHENNLL